MTNVILHCESDNKICNCCNLIFLKLLLYSWDFKFEIENLSIGIVTFIHNQPGIYVYMHNNQVLFLSEK